MSIWLGVGLLARANPTQNLKVIQYVQGLALQQAEDPGYEPVLWLSLSEVCLTMLGVQAAWKLC